MSKVKSLEVKKLLKELEFIESDFEYRNEIISEADSNFINSINEFLQNHPELKEIYDNKVTEKINQTIEKTQKEIDEKLIEDELYDKVEEDSSTDKKEDQNISKIKKLYREIVKLTHPDKVKIKKLNDLYLKSTEYYDNRDLIGIYAVCNELNIPYEITDDDIKIILEQINSFKNKINFLESTYTWKWFNCVDELEKNQILINYIKLKIK